MKKKKGQETQLQLALICCCFRVTRRELTRLIKEKHLTTVEEVRQKTDACNGCQTCYEDIESLLSEIWR